jgi:hypothetical protein
MRLEIRVNLLNPCHPRSIALRSDRGLRVKPAMTGLLRSPSLVGRGQGERSKHVNRYS